MIGMKRIGLASVQRGVASRALSTYFNTSTAKRSTRDFRPKSRRGDNILTEELRKDQSWPLYTGHDLYFDVAEKVNVIEGGKTEEELKKEEQMVLQEAFRRMHHVPLKDVVLPTMKVQIKEDHPHYEALSLMKMSLINNSRISWKAKDMIMSDILDEMNELMADKTPLFQVGGI